MIIPFKFQKESIHQLIDKITYHLDSQSKVSKILMQGPTGSGKTFMCSQVIEQIKKNEHHSNVIFMWISISQGGLEVQTADKFESYGLDGVKIYNTNQFKNISSHDILCIGWSALKAKSNDEDVKTVNYKKHTEKLSSFEAQIKKLQQNHQFILFIDEAHNTSNSTLSQEIIDMIAPKVIIDVTATPKAGSYQDEVIITKQTAKESGIIKQAVIINHDLASEEYISEKILLNKAKNKREDIEAKFNELKMNINPLVLIQLKNEDAKETESRLIDIGIPENQIAIWLNNNKKNLDNITKNDNPVSYLICNQAIATGWDCPRAHILVQMLKASEDFSEQIVGRILRTVDVKNFNDDDLDNAFVYTITNKENIEKIEEKIKTIHEVQYEMILNTNIGINLEKINQQISKFKTQFFESITTDDAFIQYRPEIKKQIKANILKNLNQLEDAPPIEVEIKTGTIDAQEVTALKVSEQIGVNKKVDISMMEKYVVEQFELPPILYRLVEDLANDFNIKISQPLLDMAKNQLKQVINAHKEIETKIYSLSDKYKITTSLHGIKSIKSLFLHEGKYYSNKAMSEPEKLFIEALENSTEVIWWFKNFDGGKKALSFIYQEDDEDKLHFPDFIIQTSKEILLIEIKFKSTKELEFPTNNIKFETFGSKNDLNYKMVFVDTKNKTFYEKTGFDKDDITGFSLNS